MGFSSASHWAIVLLIAVVIFSAGKLPRIAGDLAKGIKTFKAGMKNDDMLAVATTHHDGKLG
ncbi:MAG: twin-arginine translocase TatA/TatE family subunit [Geminicoccaceae bacterium]